MKIYILPIDEKFKPREQSWTYPKHNDQFGVEEDFAKYLIKNPNLLTDDPNLADWHYLPVLWTRYHVGNENASRGLPELQEAVNNSILDDRKTFTVCQYDDGPVVNLGNTVQFLASRKTSAGLDIPLLCKPHRVPFFKPSKKYLASFVGYARTHEIRKEIITELRDRKDILIYDGNKGSRYFVETTLKSYVALAPRGYGGSSYRFFEAMQLGVTPFLIGDLDTRPFKDLIPYDKFSLYTDNPKNIYGILNSKSKSKLKEMGKLARKIYKENLAYQKWCPFVIKKLSNIR